MLESTLNCILNCQVVILTHHSMFSANFKCMPISHRQLQIHSVWCTHRHAAYTRCEPCCKTNSVCIRKWQQGDWINYFLLQVGVFGCQTSLSHTGETVILPHELNMTEHRQRHTKVHRFKHTHMYMWIHVCVFAYACNIYTRELILARTYTHSYCLSVR